MTVRRPRRVPAGPGVFVAGAAMFALELLGPRRLAPVVGTSFSSMTAAISVVLLGSALGAAWAGRRGARGLSHRAEGVALVAAAIGVAVGTAFARQVVLAAPHGLSTAELSWVGAIAMLLLPSASLGAVAIFAARRVVAERTDEVGALGRLSAIGTVGGVAGLVLVAIVLIPHVAVSVSLYAIALALASVGAALIAIRSRAPSSEGLETPMFSATPATTLPIGVPRLAFAAAAVGFAVLCLEVTAARRVCARVGSSLEAWITVLTVVLLATAIGAATTKDRATDRPRTTSLSRAACLVTLIALLDGLGLSTALRVPGLAPTGSVFLGTALVYGPAFVLLGAIGPRLSRAAASRSVTAGRGLAAISAAGTLGALVATVATAPWILPAVHSEGAIAIASLAAIAATAAIGGTSGVGGRDSRARIALSTAPALVLLAVAITHPSWLRSAPPRGSSPDAGVVVFDEDGVYARVAVVESGEPADRMRRLSIDARIHGSVAFDRPSPPPSRYMALANAVIDRCVEEVIEPRILMLGGGAFAISHEFLRRHPTGHCDVIELDDTVTEAARALLLLRDDSRLRVISGDARAAMASLSIDDGRYDVIFVDAFGDVSVPWTLTTREFMFDAKARLRPHGVLAYNAIDAFKPGRLIAGLHRTLRDVFRHVDVLGPMRDDDALENFVPIASDDEHDLEGLDVHVRIGGVEGVTAAERYSAAEFLELERRVGARVLTDDFAPVEDLVSSTVARTIGR